MSQPREVTPIEDAKLTEKLSRFGAAGIVYAWLLDEVLGNSEAHVAVDNAFNEHTSAAPDGAANTFPITSFKRMLGDRLGGETRLQLDQLADLLQHELCLDGVINMYLEAGELVVAMTENDAELLRERYEHLQEFPNSLAREQWSHNAVATF